MLIRLTQLGITSQPLTSVVTRCGFTTCLHYSHEFNTGCYKNHTVMSVVCLAISNAYPVVRTIQEYYYYLRSLQGHRERENGAPIGTARGARSVNMQ